MLDLQQINYLIPNILNFLSFEYHILFLQYLDNDDKLILHENRSFIFNQLMHPNNLLDMKYIINLNKVANPKINRLTNFYNESKLHFLLVFNNKHKLLKYIYKNINKQNNKYLFKNPYIYEYLLNSKMTSNKGLINQCKYFMDNIYSYNYIYEMCDEMPSTFNYIQISYNLINILNKDAYHRLIKKLNQKEYKKILKAVQKEEKELELLVNNFQ